MEDWRNEHMLKTGFADKYQMADYIAEDEKYEEDVFGEEIKKGDQFYLDEFDQKIHVKSISRYVSEDIGLRLHTRF